MAMDIEKTIGSYAKIYRKVLVEGKIKDIDDEIRLYQKRLREMYNSDAFQKHERNIETDIDNSVFVGMQR